MRFLRRLLGSPPSQEPNDFGAFLHRQGAFVAQKTVLDYCRVKVGRSENAFFDNPHFQAALKHCRWQVFLAAQSDVVAPAEAWLRPFWRCQEPPLADRLVALHADFMAEEAPPADEQETFSASLAALPGHLAGLQLAAPHDARTLPLLAEAPLFATLPIHPEQRKGEGPFHPRRAAVSHGFHLTGNGTRLRPGRAFGKTCGRNRRGALTQGQVCWFGGSCARRPCGTAADY